MDIYGICIQYECYVEERCFECKHCDKQCKDCSLEDDVAYDAIKQIKELL